MAQLSILSKQIMCEHAFNENMNIHENQILLENILHTLKDKLKSMLKNFKLAWSEQRSDFRGFRDLVYRFVTRKPMTSQELKKLQRNFTDVLKLSGVAITFPVLGVAGNMLLGWLTKKLSQGRFTTLPSQFAKNLLDKGQTTKYTTDGIDTPGDPNM